MSLTLYLIEVPHKSPGHPECALSASASSTLTGSQHSPWLSKEEAKAAEKESGAQDASCNPLTLLSLPSLRQGH